MILNLFIRSAQRCFPKIINFIHKHFLLTTSDFPRVARLLSNTVAFFVLLRSITIPVKVHYRVGGCLVYIDYWDVLKCYVKLTVLIGR